MSSVSQDLAFFLKHFVECSVRPQIQLQLQLQLSTTSSLAERNYNATQLQSAKEKMDKVEDNSKFLPAVPRPKPLDLSHHLSPLARRFKQSKVQGLYKYGAIPGMANLAGGMPHPSFFPFDSLSATALTPNHFTTALHTTFLQLLVSIKKPSHFTIPKFPPPNSSDLSTDIYLARALQYGTCEGLPVLLDFIRDFAVNCQHQGKIPYDSPSVIMTSGNTDGFNKALEVLADPYRGDKILMEKFVYKGAVNTAACRGIDVVPVDVDKEGMVVEGDDGLQGILESWDVRRDGPRPHLLYTVTMGQNPTAGVLGVKRRKQIYALCQKYDIIILEDDPYWFLQYDLFAEVPDNDTFLSTLVPSYVTIDTDGRVLRFDTFSKSMAPGCRLGWIIGHPAIVDRILRLSELTTRMPSGPTQALVAKLLVHTWSVSGWITWLSLLRHRYESRMNTLCVALEAGKTVTMIHLKNIRLKEIVDQDGNVIDGGKYSLVHKAVKELYEFERPMGGMFVWVRVYFEIHRLYDGTNGREIMRALWEYLAGEEIRCLVCPGQAFGATDEVEEREAWKYFRLCFAAAEEAELRRASVAFGNGVKEFFELQEFPKRDDEENATAVDLRTPRFC
ncbi:uncharacterized protein DFL_002588 [Arthrobotrys flagrans]|uniref:Aminotransferase class I/classII large domain-containing protein n=1 Tax=Arthrobotrys flagrans TaxID=97331 RepID=A0A437AB82_ARTFL|nr:hypothetical protein DFL_002588 [Arthrobotrys flagrans]